MTLEELVTEKRVLGSQILKLVQEFEEKYKCYAEIQQNCTAGLYSQTPRTLAIEVEVRL